MSQTTLPKSPVSSAGPSLQRRKFTAAIEGYLYLAPTLIILGVFVFLPIFTSFQMSLTRVAPFGNQTRPVGMENYTSLLSDPEYWDIVMTSIIFMLGTVPTGIIIAIALAIALSVPVKRLSWFHRLLIFIPVVISSAVTGVLFRWLYHPVVGYLNYWLSLIGVDGPNWLATKDWALVAVIIAVVWNQLGFNVIIALAGVQNIDSTFYEAAKVDGANVWHRVRHITLPLLSPTIFFLLVINLINSLQVFGQIEVLTQGGPGQATTTLIFSIYYDAFVGTPQRGIASAQAYLLAIMIFIMTIGQFRIGNRRVHYQ